jgi:tripartite-type tricarboxylate transporter receptor subunit TctC
MVRSHSLRVGALVGLAVVSGAHPAAADWPERPVTVIVPWAAGGGTDATGRILAQMLEEEHGVPFNVVNRTGGGGIVGHSAIATAAPDGYTIGVVTAEISTYACMGVSDLTEESFTPIGQYNIDAAGFTVAVDSEWDDLGEALDAIKEAPAGTYKLSGMPVGAAYHLAFAGLLTERGIDPKAVTVVPSQGAAPGFQELAAGGVDIVPSSLPEAQAMVDAGRVQPLAVMAKQRLEAFPEVPTVKEAIGVAWASGSWRGIAAPQGVPQEIAEELATSLERIHASEEFREFMDGRGFGLEWKGPEAFRRFMADARASNCEIVEALGLAK